MSKALSARSNDATPAKAPVRGPGRRLRGAIAHKLGTDILAGVFAPGDVLPGEVLFAEELEVSRSAYREFSRDLLAGDPVAHRA